MVHEESRIRLSVIQLFVGSTSNIRGYEEDEEEGGGAKGGQGDPWVSGVEVRTSINMLVRDS